MKLQSYTQEMVSLAKDWEQDINSLAVLVQMKENKNNMHCSAN